MSVTDEVYKSAVQDRQDLRTALRKYKAENKALKESRDELLEAYKEHRWDMCRLGVNEELIQRAQALKEKEGNE